MPETKTQAAPATAQTSVFAKFTPSVWPYKFDGALFVASIAGGTPSDPNVAEGWLKSKTAAKHDLIRDKAMEIVVERGIELDEAIRELDKLKHLNGFKRDPQLGLYIEGR